MATAEVQTKIDAVTARRRVNAFLVWRIGERLCGGEPIELTGSQWRVPVWVSTPTRGMIQQIGTLAVDAETGEVKAEQGDVEALRSAARAVLVDETD